MKNMSYVFLLFTTMLCVSQTNAQWVQSNLPGSGYVLTFAVSGTNLFAGTAVGGVFLTTDNGTNWTAVNNGLTNTTVYTLAVSGRNLFAGTHGGGVFLSTNNGTSWTAVSGGLTNTDVRALAVSGTNLFAGTDSGGVFLSTNNGASWTAAGLTSSTVLAFAVSGTNLFAGTWGAGVFLSTNNGTSWTWVNNGLTNPYVLAFAVSGANLFAGAWAGGVFLSTNNGTSWTAVNNGLTLPHFVQALAISGTSIFAGTANSQNPGSVFLSTNNGTSWAEADSGLTSLDVRTLAVSGTSLFAGTEAGRVWRRPLSEMITSVDDRKPLPVEFRLAQNYPNPFNPGTTIRYALPQRAAVTLAVFNALGQEVARLVEEEREAGSHEVRFDAAGLPSGVYFCRLTAGTFSAARKLLLLR